MDKKILSIICGSLIKEIRENQKIRIEYAASVSGICSSKLSKIENGNQLLDVLSLCELCKVYDMDPGAVISHVGMQYLKHSPSPL